AKDFSWVEFSINPKAKWHDGKPITVDDVVFTFTILPEKGDPSFKIALEQLKSVEKTGKNRVLFTFSQSNLRKLPLLVAQIPILPSHFWDGEKNALDKSTLVPPLGSGPYKVSNVNQGRSITYERVKDYWAKDLPVNRGMYNFDVVDFQTFRDSTVALEGIKAGRYDVREENISRNWATAYDTPAARDGRLLKQFIPHKLPTGNQAFVINSERYPDRRVREALGLAFDFDWTNRVIFFGAYSQNSSFFQNTEFAAQGLPSKAELKLLEPFRDQLPPELFTTAYEAPSTEQKKTTIRDNLLKAQKLLNDAGYIIKDGVRVHKDTGEPLTASILYYEPSFNRVFMPMINNLKRLGIPTHIKTVEIAQYQLLMDAKDYDISIMWYNNGVFFPGMEQKSYWSCETAQVKGSPNYAKACHPALDALTKKLEAADDIDELRTTAHALDRVLLWEHYTIPQYHISGFRLIHWDKFNKPKRPPSYSIGMTTWWMKKEGEQAVPSAAEAAPATTTEEAE
ncbi:MAG: ABC transporter substrate-binding protein, partial [Alphaproteobacteria bacterium]|nr:ABC transporter substrate-binding protein [Alphaproteobacteria bacterium]